MQRLAGILTVMWLATFSTAACPGPDGEPAGDGDGDTAGDGDEGGDGDGDGAGEATGDGDGDAPGDGDGDGDQPPAFSNQLAPALSAVEGTRFSCSDGQASYLVGFLPSGQLLVEGEEQVAGSWVQSGQGLTLTVPDLAFQETSDEHHVRFDRLVVFYTPSLRCHAVALDVGPGPAFETYTCPTIRYTPELFYEDNTLQLGTDGSAWRRRWEELLDVSDTLYSEYFGVFVEVDGWVLLAFGDAPEDQRVLTARVTPEGGLLVQELEPESGPCVEAP